MNAVDRADPDNDGRDQHSQADPPTDSTADPHPDHGRALLALYDRALPEVHGYLLKRCRGRPLAEDLTSETFLAALGAAKAGRVETVTVAWLIGIARNKLVDHWRREEREQRKLTAVAGGLDTEHPDHWDEVLDRRVSGEVLAALAPQHRAALTLRYVDGLPVAEVAAHLDRTHQATEALLTRSKVAFRRTYAEQGGGS
ncbi:MAG: sigma-70 family RNA polymerase sigma factor [Actinomycetota bacterium]